MKILSLFIRQQKRKSSSPECVTCSDDNREDMLTWCVVCWAYCLCIPRVVSSFLRVAVDINNIHWKSYHYYFSYISHHIWLFWFSLSGNMINNKTKHLFTNCYTKLNDSSCVQITFLQITRTRSLSFEIYCTHKYL